MDWRSAAMNLSPARAMISDQPIHLVVPSLHMSDKASSPSLQALINSKVLKQYLHRHSASSEEAADVYQESIARVLEQSRGSVIDNPLAYAFRVARNLLAKRRTHETCDIEEQHCYRQNPELYLETQQRIELISEVINAMPEQRRRVFEMRRIEGQSRQDIAARLNISAEAVTKHISRAMTDIQLQLDKAGK